MEENRCPHCGAPQAEANPGTNWHCSSCDGLYVVGRSAEEAGPASSHSSVTIAGEFAAAPAVSSSSPEPRTKVEENRCPHCGSTEAAANTGTNWRCSSCDGLYVVGRSAEEAGPAAHVPPPESGFTRPKPLDPWETN